MGPAEIVSRLAEAGRHVLLRASLDGVRRRAHKLPGNSPPPRNVPELKGRLGEVPVQFRRDIVAIADGWVSHRATFFGLRDSPLGDPIDWHRDYSSGVVGPMKYSSLIDHRDKAVAGDIKYIWELNRLQHLVLLALSGIFTGNGGYGKTIERQIRSWAAQNPFMRGVNWKSPLEAGLRLIALAYVRFLSGTVMEENGHFRNVMREMVYEHQYFIRKFYSKHSSANNHLIGEMTGLYVASAFWPWYEESEDWRAFARNILTEECLRQVGDDGVGKERSSEYQIFVLEFFLIAGMLGEVIGDPFPQEYWNRVGRMVGFLSAISDQSGNLPLFGDGDSGQAVWLPESTPERARSLFRFGRRAGESDLNRDLRAALLSWGRTSEVPIGWLSNPRNGLQVFPEGGYYVLATDRGGGNEMVVVFDAGPLGLPPLYAHGHADALSFWLSYGGQEFLIDPGTFCYYSSAVWRSYFRGTAAHNTARLDGQDQSVAGGPFLWRHMADCRAERVDDNDEFIEVEGFHDGYRRLADPVIHRRRIRLSKKSPSLSITDRLECRGTHDVELFFHFNEKCHLRRAGQNSFLVSNGNKQLILRFLSPQLGTELYRGSESPICGWVSRTFDVKQPCFTLAARTRITGPTELPTEITPADMSAA